MILNQKAFTSTIMSNIVFGVDSVKNNLPRKIKEYSNSKVFLATDAGLVKAGIVDEITSLLQENNIDYVVFSDVEPNPHATTVMKGIEIYKEENCDLIVAIGGGSPIDFAKAVGVMASNPGHILDYRRGKKEITHEPPVLFAIPTTVGTGSEVTNISVVTDSDDERKYVIVSPLLTPKFAFVDPTLTLSLPRHVVSTTSLDAFVHALEAYTSVGANPISDGFALQAIHMLQENIPASYAQPDNMEARSQIHLASTIAGLAFGNGGLGMVHSCSHPMSARYNAPHGLANAVILPHVVEHNLISNYKRYADIARIFEPELEHVTNKKAAEALVDILKDFTKSVDIPEKFNHFNFEFTEEMVDQLADDAMNDVGTIPKNPRKAEKEDIIKIYKKVLPLK